ncbi:type I secretion system membrane fusion protein PrsE [mine drainage metagenome]|uniref:Type I secretion system membrane fusion protein PrsE n=1 Tax=mine drainage metagenome TaxID=410659 RepID=A0A1J5S2A6_9ZZZZ
MSAKHLLSGAWLAHQFDRYLADPIVFEEGGVRPLVRASILTVVAIVLAMAVWASLTEVKEVASTNGAVVPSSNVRQIQHVEGGQIAQVLVREGQLVEKGAVLVRFDPVQIQTELAQVKAREAGLELRAERLRAFAAGRVPDFPADDRSSPQEKDQEAIFLSQEKNRTDAIQVLTKQQAERQSEVDLYRQQIASLEPQIDLAQKEEGIRDEGFRMGLNSKLVLIQAQRETARLDGEKVRLIGQLKTAQDALAEAQNHLTEQRSKLAQDALTEMGTVSTELAQVREATAKQEDRLAHVNVMAPVRGLVQELKVTGPGSVVPPGGEIMKLVPVDDELKVETRIQPRDIGHVAVGQKVMVKVSSYDFSRFGGVQGVLEQVSPTTFLDEEKKPYYRGVVKLAHPYVGTEKDRILPGMVVQADIETGQKTVLQYMLKPVVLAFQQAFHER